MIRSTYPHRDGRQEAERHDGDDAEQIDVVQTLQHEQQGVRRLACASNQAASSAPTGTDGAQVWVRSAPGIRCIGRALTLPPIMNFFDSTLRDWKLMLLPMAAAKPPQSKVTCARQTPLPAYAQYTGALVL
jgi:hypothetical protein